MHSSTDALVIGAGPAGLATSHALAQAGVEHVVLERGGRAGTTWANLYDSLVLHTARRLSALPGLAFPPGTPVFPTRRDLAAYLDRYAETFRLPIETGVDVTRLRPENGHWIADTADGRIIRARCAVVATGIVSNPVRPDLPGRARFGGRLIHSVEYRRPDEFIGQRVLVIGAGNSAGEIAAELAHQGAEVTVAVRSGALVVPRSVAGVPIQYFAIPLAALPRRAQRAASAAVAWLSSLARGPAVLPPASETTCSRVPLIGFHLTDGIRSGTIRLQRGTVELTAEGVRFADGTEQTFEAVIMATGFRAAVGLLGQAIRLDDCGFARREGLVASADQRRLYFVGHNYGLRGGLLNIGRDARLAARRVRADLERHDRSRTPTEMPRRPNGR